MACLSASDGAVAPRAGLVELRLAHELALDEILHALILVGFSLERAARGVESRTRLDDLLRARSLHELGEAMLRDVAGRDGLIETRLHGAELLAHERRAGRDGVAFAHRDLDDRLVGFRDQLQAIALQRAEDLAVVAVAARD